MTPKEKAEELVHKFIMNVLDYEGTSINDHKAKQCALIVVDELIKATEDVWFLDGNYWQEVKHEIEKL